MERRKLPTNYLTVINDGTHALSDIANRLQAAAERTPESPELWLDFRNVAGLAGRLEPDEELWQLGVAAVWYGGQDFGVLDELIERDPALRITTFAAVTDAEVIRLRALRAFLRAYENGALERDDGGAPERDDRGA